MRLRKLNVSILLVFFALMFTSIQLPTIDEEEQHLKVIVRMIGDEFLLQLGDSTSRIMPIEKHEGRYLLQFENEFEFEPDMLAFSAVKVFEEAKFKSDFILETRNCITNELVHSFEVSSKLDDSLLPCRGRPLPKGCYQVYITILKKEAKSHPVLITKEKKTVKSDFSYYYIIALGVLLLGGVLYWVKRKKSLVDNPNWLQIGEYQFDKNGMKLIYKGKVEELSSKEASLLELLFTNVNKTVTRESILQVVWEDDGDYLGRTLDVFISKLRKKLEADSNLKIVNIRGVGYRIVINQNR